MFTPPYSITTAKETYSVRFIADVASIWANSDENMVITDANGIVITPEDIQCLLK